MAEITVELPDEVYAAFVAASPDYENVQQFLGVLLSIGICLWDAMGPEAIKMAADIFDAAQEMGPDFELRLGGLLVAAPVPNPEDN